jgi:CTP:molybdopterin cytidylyltransferase MocA
MNTSIEVACIILSGGLSSRMKRHKALLPFSKDENFLQHIINVYQNAGVQKIIVVKNSDIDLSKYQVHDSISILENPFPGKGRLYSIQLGVSKATTAKYLFIQNIDNPFVNEALIESLLKARRQSDYITPIHNNRGGHPILISNNIIKKIRSLTKYDMTLREVLNDFKRHIVAAEDDTCLVNINEAIDYETFILKNIIQTCE